MKTIKKIVLATLWLGVTTVCGMQEQPEKSKPRFKKPKAKVMLDVSVEDGEDETVFFIDRKITIPLKKGHRVRTVPVGTISVRYDGRTVILPKMTGDYKKAYEELRSVMQRLPAIIKDGNIDCKYAPVAQ